MQISMTVNGTDVTSEIEPRVLLVHYIREVLGLTGTHWGCDTSNCGTCVVLMDGQPVKSCTVLDDAEIRQAISGQICRCTGYATIVRSVQWAAAHPAGTGLDEAPAAEEVLDGTDTAVPDVAAEIEDTEVKA